MSKVNDSLNGIPYVKMRLAQIASGDYRACGLSAEEVARDAFAELTKTPEIVSSENLSNAMGESSTRKDEDAELGVPNSPAHTLQCCIDLPSNGGCSCGAEVKRREILVIERLVNMADQTDNSEEFNLLYEAANTIKRLHKPVSIALEKLVYPLEQILDGNDTFKSRSDYCKHLARAVLSVAGVSYVE